MLIERVALAARHRVAARPGERAFHADLRAPVHPGDAERQLPAGHRIAKRVGRREEQQVGGDIQPGGQASTARKRAAPAGIGRRVEVDDRQAPSRLSGRGGEAGVLPWQPEAHAAFVGRCGMRHEQAPPSRAAQSPTAPNVGTDERPERMIFHHIISLDVSTRRVTGHAPWFTAFGFAKSSPGVSRWSWFDLRTRLRGRCIGPRSHGIQSPDLIGAVARDAARKPMGSGG